MPNVKTNNHKHKQKQHHHQQRQREDSLGLKEQQQGANILNVAEMLLHGVADHEILGVWLRSISCQEFVKNFISAGYDVPTISRITPQDLTAIGITDPTKRLKILSEIKKLNLQDGLPDFVPTSLKHWLNLLRLEEEYHQILCDQQIDTIDKMCQLTWEDFEELGITKLGHQKRIQLAIERLKEIGLESNDSKKSLSEPIYDTNPSQILLVAPTENHSMNGPIINKISSKTELSSTGSGSMHSVYSANSTQYQPIYAPAYQQQPAQVKIQQMQLNNNDVHRREPPPGHIINQQPPQPAPSQSNIYSQPPMQNLPQQISNPHLAPIRTIQSQNTIQHTRFEIDRLSHIYGHGPISNDSANRGFLGNHNQQNRQSMSHFPIAAFANLPKHQQQLLQQSSIYATLGRQPQRVKKPPPPVPIRTNSLKSGSLFEDPDEKLSNGTSMQEKNSCNLTRAGTRLVKNHHGSQTMLPKNKSFSGNAHMESIRARFLNRNIHQHQADVHSLSNHTETWNGMNGRQNLLHNNCDVINRNSRQPPELDTMSILSRQSVATEFSMPEPKGCNGYSNPLKQLNQQTLRTAHANNLNSIMTPPSLFPHIDDFENNLDSISTNSLNLRPSNSQILSSQINQTQTDNSENGSGSSQTLYNSASSDCNEQNTDFRKINDMLSSPSAISNSTLNDINLVLENNGHEHQISSLRGGRVEAPRIATNDVPARDGAHGNRDYNATTGKDDEFPPPPSPLSTTDSEDITSLNAESNFTDMTNGLVAFKIGI